MRAILGTLVRPQLCLPSGFKEQRRGPGAEGPASRDGGSQVSHQSSIQPTPGSRPWGPRGSPPRSPHTPGVSCLEKEAEQAALRPQDEGRGFCKGREGAEVCLPELSWQVALPSRGPQRAGQRLPRLRVGRTSCCS